MTETPFHSLSRVWLRRVAAICGIFALVLAVALAIARDTAADTKKRDPLDDFQGRDPLELAHLVHKLGDAHVLARLRDESATGTRLFAIEAAPFLREAPRALNVLSEIARGRDPDLGPAAVSSALRIARTVDAARLLEQEVLASDLGPARRHFAELSSDRSARLDLRAAAAAIVDALRTAGVPR